MIILAGLVLRVAALYLYPHAPESDELTYLSMAHNLVSGQGVVDHAGNRAMYNVGYPLFVLAPSFLIFGESLAALQAINVLLGCVAIVMAYFVAREAGAGKTGRLLAAAMLALYLPAAMYPVYIFKENLMIPLMLGAIWCALRLTVKVQATTVIACGVLFGLLALTGNAALVLGAPVAFAVLFFSHNRVRSLGWLALIFVTAALVATPWLIRNAQVLGAPVLNTNGGFNLYLGNNPAATGMYMSIAQTPRGESWSELRKGGEVQAAETLKREAIAWIKEHPVQFATLALRKLAYFWTPPLHEGKDAPSRIQSLVRGAWAIQYFILTGAAIGGLMAAGLRNRRVAVLWMAVAAYTAVHMLFYVIYRYREPIIPVVCVLAALSLERLYMRLQAKSSKQVAGKAAVVGPARASK